MTVLVADEGLLGLAELVPSHCEIRWYSGRDISPTYWRVQMHC
jgi:erythronate-4-phosphate dehydrogenase